MSSSTLPTSRDFVTQLLNSLPLPPQHDANAFSLNDAPDSIKKQLLSLQVLFPNEFLPALDLLDRKLITRFLIGNAAPLPTTSTNTPRVNVQMQASDTLSNNAGNLMIPDLPKPLPPQQDTLNLSDTVHYVRSAQQRSSRYSTSYDSTTSYEVRLQAWNCTCPAFAFAAFPSVLSEPPVFTYKPTSASIGSREVHEPSRDAVESEAMKWVFGGVSLGLGMPPVCKHLLACVLAERCSGVFGECVEERRVSVETAAGWAAGWGGS
ncbi:uncharacterized protein EKO05_0008532 [Ascochyta rabiei]|uniref:uncharacterized protein n=1 Tax=Didymella rabiei TaxID=5454 RepID=UPI0019013864|nr:uncharacterized protein EKO05_0008532 [Ascochyta rabiei]UPX18225.1 hypothetical protein EKO05_0008532 [Ascochyta rabiei]